METTEERIVYLNGSFIRDSEAKISIHDSGFSGAEVVFDVSRTFKGKPFKLHEHIERLFKSLKYLRMDPGIGPEEMERLSLQVLQKNLHLLGENEDYWITQYVTRGTVDPETGKQKPTLCILCKPLVYTPEVEGYKTGVRLVTPSNRHVPPISVDPKIKIQGRIWLKLAALEAQQLDPDALALVLDLDGNVTELPRGANFFIANKGELWTPSQRNILVGVSRQTVLELASELEIPAYERDFQVYNVYNADEAFFTVTSRCIIPVSHLNGIKIGHQVPGPITEKLLKTWGDKVGVDIAQQALSWKPLSIQD